VSSSLTTQPVRAHHPISVALFEFAMPTAFHYETTSNATKL